MGELFLFLTNNGSNKEWTQPLFELFVLLTMKWSKQRQPKLNQNEIKTTTKNTKSRRKSSQRSAKKEGKNEQNHLWNGHLFESISYFNVISIFESMINCIDL